MPNFCYKCGSPLRDGAKFCTGCGSPVRQDVSAVNVSNVQTAPTTIIMPTEPTAAAVSTVTAAAAIKPKRYILLRIVLFLVCGALLFCGWRWGIPNVKKAMLEPSAFSPAVSEGENPEELQAQYDEILRQVVENTDDSESGDPVHMLYDWIYRE